MPRTEEEINNLLGSAAIPNNYYESLKPQYRKLLLDLIENQNVANFIAGYPNGPTIILNFIAGLKPPLGDTAINTLSTILEQKELRNTINSKGLTALDLLCNFIANNVNENIIKLKQDAINYLVNTIPTQRPNSSFFNNTTNTERGFGPETGKPSRP
ncbi:hypothetical protein [Legionella gresilensis]|uniref:hypothetical protein n=1 Tax=Legionella gresilensis TaxID=91823 RepID=UPI0010417FC2|nr:hypothetical protein [Legionella gresilensis]